MKLFEILECNCEYEVVYITEDGEVIEEGFIRQMKRVGTKLKKQYRCTSGPRRGRIVADPSSCPKRKDPKKRREGKKVAREKKGVRIRKSKISKKKTLSKMVTKINQRLKGSRTLSQS